VCNRSFIVCLDVRAVFFLHDVLFCVICVFVCYLIIGPLPLGKNPFAINNNYNNNNNKYPYTVLLQLLKIGFS
jgi:hypothetical protein